MINLQDFIGNSKMFKKLEAGDLLFTEFKCPIQESKSRLWWHNNFFAFVLSGETLIETAQNTYHLKAGDAVFAKKGCVISHAETHDDFCELLVFVPDSFIKSVYLKYKPDKEPVHLNSNTDTVVPLSADELLVAYFHSLLAHFNQPEPPSALILKLKFEELIADILSGKKHAALQCYFREISGNTKPSIPGIMEANFQHNLGLEEFARLCARSLSVFKLDFNAIYGTSPGKWLLQKRLAYSKYLLQTTNYNVTEIAFESGFENRSHYSRSFKEKFGYPPSKHRQAALI